MALSTFDTLKFVRRLEAVGVSAQQAEAQAEVLTEAFNVNLDALVTKDFLAARFAEQSASINTRFAEHNASRDARFAEQNGKIDSNHRIFVWTQAIIMAAVILPYLERLLALA
jgi:hypothetical protein